MATTAPAPVTQGEVDALKANLSAGFGAAANEVRGRDAAIAAAYDAVSQQIRADAANRQARDAASLAAEQRGMASAAAALGVAPPVMPSSRRASIASVLADQFNGNANGWGTYLGSMGGFERDRNRGVAAAFDEGGRRAGLDAQYEFEDMLARGYGGGGYGGGGGRGGRNYDDEPLVEYPGSVTGMSKGAIRGLAATGIRLEKQGDAFKKAGLVGPGSAQEYGKRLAQGMLKGRK